MRFIYIVFAISVIGVAGCNNTNTQTANTGKTDTVISHKPEGVHSKMNDAGTQILMSVVSRYYTLKNALVATKSEDANKAAAQLATTADSLHAFLEKDTSNMALLKPYMDTIIMQSKLLSAVDDKTCEKQRLSFDEISSAMYGLLKKVELKNATIYHEFCPMAFNDKGAFWLSDETEIKNPYFGRKMLECGEVTDSLK